ncbi:MAG: hypothetical protein P0119_14840 [Nitrospira sp.]|nr:hypothetical protein [Nitrospira sp.]
MYGGIDLHANNSVIVLVDGLMEAGYSVHLANTAAIQQYEGLKQTNNHSDAQW